MTGPIRGPAGHRAERLGSHSPMQHSRSSSPQPPRRNEPPSIVPGTSQQAFEANSTASDRSWPTIAMHVTAPSRSSSPAPPASALGVSLAPLVELAEPSNQLAISSNVNVNNNAPGGTIINNNSVTQVVSNEKTAEELNTMIEKGLGQHHVPRALYDAQPQSGGCMEGTRVELLEDTQKLITTCGGAHIVWIAGMAGTGKTSIALTLCRRLAKIPTVLLGGTFFCSRSAGVIERTDVECIIPTLATILARRLPAYARALAVELKKDPDLATKGVNVQVNSILVQPLKSVRTLDGQIVLVIDALDECRDQDTLAELVNALADFESTPLNYPANRLRLTKLIDDLADFIESRGKDQARPLQQGEQARLAKLGYVLADFKATPLDEYDNQERLESFIDSLSGFKKTPLKDDDDQKVLETFIHTLADFRSTPPIKFLLTSRPEVKIRGTSITDTSLSSIVQLHMVDEELVTSDIRLYIQKTLEKSSKSSKWYVDKDIDDLASLSAGLFIFASTVLAYILRRTDGHGRSERLRTVMMQTSESVIATDPLDKMYLLVLMQASDPSAYEQNELDETRRIVAVILTARSPLTVTALAELLRLTSERLRGALDELHAVILVPEQDDEGELRGLHASFGDFVFTRAATHIRIEKSLGYDELSQACFQRMAADDLCFNVSCSRSSYESNPEIKSSQVPQSLVYACLHWAHHIALSTSKPSFDDMFQSVLRFKLPFWLEVLSVVGAVGRASVSLSLAAEKATSWDASRFFRDADSFVTSSREAITRSAPHIYLSALPFAPKDSLVYQNFFSQLAGIFQIRTFGTGSSLNNPTISVWNASEGISLGLPMDGHTAQVNAVAVSCDGRFIASASADGSARVWESQTGQRMYSPLVSYQHPVYSMALSSDCRWIATGSQAGTVQLWNAETGQSAMSELRGHTDIVSTVAFSPNNLYLASGSYDDTIHVWKVLIDQPAESVAHIQCNGQVLCLAYSLKGNVIAVGGKDNNIRIFGAITGREIRVCRGTTSGPDYISSLAFSPDGTHIAVGVGTAVGVFDYDMRCQVMEFRGHTAKVNGVAYSPDGQFIASGADDGTVRLWNPNTRRCLEPVLHGHAGVVKSVTFSLDGRFIITGGEDKTVRLWDLEKSRWLTDEREQSPLVSLAFAHYKKGWLVSPSGEVLLWVPLEYRGCLEIGGHSRIIATHRAIITTEAEILHQGEQWDLCWQTRGPLVS